MATATATHVLTGQTKAGIAMPSEPQEAGIAMASEQQEAGIAILSKKRKRALPSPPSRWTDALHF